jgi:hypothetical protein
MARRVVGGPGAILAAVIAAWALAPGGCFYPAYEVITDGAVSAAASGGASGSGGSGAGGGGASGSGGSGAGGGGASGSGGSGAGGGGGEGQGNCSPVGTETIVDCDQANPSAIAANPNVVVWTNEDSGQVVRKSKLDQEPKVIASAEDSPCGIALGNNFVYWRTRSGLLRRKLINDLNADPEMVKSNLGESCALSSDNLAVYYFDMIGDVMSPMLTMHTFSGSTNTVAAVKTPKLVASSFGQVYWTTPTALFTKNAMDNGTPPKSFPVMDPCGLTAAGPYAAATSITDQGITFLEVGAPKKIPTLAPPCGITTDATSLFWLVPSSGEVHATDIQDPKSIVVTKAKGSTPVCAIAVDDMNIYWTSCEKGSPTGRVMSAPKN